MTRLRLFCTFLFALLFPATAAAVVQDHIIIPEPAICADMSVEDQGTSPNAPITATMSQILADLDRRRLTGQPSQFQCRWVLLSGHLRMNHFRLPSGDHMFYKGLSEVYARTSPPPGLPSGSMPPTAIMIETFADPHIDFDEVDARDMELIAFVYQPLCRVVERGQGGETPRDCWRDREGYTRLLDARIHEVKTERPIRLTGERNRPLIGNLTHVEDNIGIDRNLSITAFNMRLDQLLEADVTVRPTDRLDARTISHRPGNPAIVRPGEVELVARIPPSWDERQVALFVANYDPDRGLGTYPASYGCVCLSGDCSDQWPLHTNDLDRVHGDFLCRIIRHHDDFLLELREP